MVAFISTGCRVVAVPNRVVINSPPVRVVSGPPIEYGYEPILYNGYVVYFTSNGIPYYWKGGARVWIPQKSRQHYVKYWNRHKVAYNNWYRHHGSDYRHKRYLDRDGNPPGPAGGRGTNWENPPGPIGGPGVSTDR